MSKIFSLFFLLFRIESIFCQYITLNFKTNIDLNSINEFNYLKIENEKQIYVDFTIGESNQVIPMTLKNYAIPNFYSFFKFFRERYCD